MLYVEDNAVTTKNAQRLAADLKYDMLVATTVAEGLSLLDQPLDLILVDMELPDGTGLALVQQARKRMPTVPIVVISGFALFGEERVCFEAGCTDYIRKPVTLARMTELLKRYTPPT